MTRVDLIDDVALPMWQAPWKDQWIYSVLMYGRSIPLAEPLACPLAIHRWLYTATAAPFVFERRCLTPALSRFATEPVRLLGGFGVDLSPPDDYPAKLASTRL